jgi:hypothetical protein
MINMVPRTCKCGTSQQSIGMVYNKQRGNASQDMAPAAYVYDKLYRKEHCNTDVVGARTTMERPPIDAPAPWSLRRWTPLQECAGRRGAASWGPWCSDESGRDYRTTRRTGGDEVGIRICASPSYVYDKPNYSGVIFSWSCGVVSQKENTVETVSPPKIEARSTGSLVRRKEAAPLWGGYPCTFGSLFMVNNGMGDPMMHGRRLPRAVFTINTKGTRRYTP